MGSFSFTCCISDLPIECGDKVRYLLLTENPYNESTKCYIYDLWFPRTYPIRAEYNDYGSVENVQSGPSKKIWLDGLKYDLVERAWGDNSCHDASTSKDMSFDHLRMALWEGRVQVKRDVPLYPEDPSSTGYEPGPKLAAELEDDNSKKGVPSRKRIEKLLIKAGYSIFDGTHGRDKVIVDEENYGHVRVRIGDFGDGDSVFLKLEEVIKAAGYAAMATRGSGKSSTMGNEVLVRPLPSVKDYYFFDVKENESQPPLLVRQAMVREDVWQQICRLTIEGSYWSNDEPVTVSYYRKKAQETWDKMVKARKDDEARIAGIKDEKLRELMASARLEGVLFRESEFGRDPIPFSIGPAAHFRFMSKNADNLTDKQISEFLDSAAEFVFVQHYLSMVRYQWRPSYGNGPQFGEWRMHEEFHKICAWLSCQQADADDVEKAKDEAEYQKYLKKAEAKKSKKKPTKAKLKSKKRAAQNASH